MCGIAGIINWTEKPVSKEDLGQMNFFLKERGPDNQGYWINNNVGFAHSRLSIIDLSSLGHQPMSDKDEIVWITYNGEIYNFLDIKKELEKKGVAFKSNSDTEVLVYGYLEWGLDALLKKLNGMFAFAIWDTRTKECLLARDRFGQKPLYYFSNEKCFLFSSDIRSIWKLKKSNLSLNYRSLDYYLSELSSPQPFSIWNEIMQLKAGHYLITKNGGKIAEKPYWLIDYSEKEKISIEESIEETERLLSRAIKLRTISDVPIGAFLSGGVDSGLISSLLAKESKSPIKTFTVGLEGFDEMNELPEARIVANRYKTDHHEIIANADLTTSIEQLMSYTGEPFADSSLIPSYFICKAISNKVKVALSGDGGDEFFGGYYEYLWAFYADDIRKKNGIYTTLKNYSAKFFNRFCSKQSLFPIFYEYSQIAGHQKLFRRMGFNSTEKKKLLKDSAYSEFTADYLSNAWSKNNYKSITDTLSNASLNTRLINDYLVKIDRASMINSLEVRSPFLDKDLTEFSARIPLEHKFHNGQSKYILKAIASKYFDKNIFKRSKKGFGIPVDNWINKELAEEIDNTLLNPASKTSQILNQAYIKNILKEHRSKKENHAHRIWALFCFEKWGQTYL